MAIKFDPSQVVGYGLYGPNTAESMADILKSWNLELAYNPQNREFTILGSADVSVSYIEDLIRFTVYYGLTPKIEDRTDVFGNKIVILVDNGKKFEKLESKFLTWLAGQQSPL